MSASNNYDCGCLAARSWIDWPLRSLIYFCWLLASLPLTPGISICKILSSVSGWLPFFMKKRQFFFIFVFSLLVLWGMPANWSNNSFAEWYYWKYQNSWEEFKVYLPVTLNIQEDFFVDCREKWIYEVNDMKTVEQWISIPSREHLAAHFNYLVLDVHFNYFK